MRRGEPLFEQACRRAVSLEVGGVEHQGAIKSRLICQFIENFVENSDFAPPDKTVVQGFVRAVLIRWSFPLKSRLDDVYDDAPRVCHRHEEHHENGERTV